MRSPGPLATNPILFLCVSRILQVGYLRKSEHLYLISHRISLILMLMSIELREICRVIHVMSPNSNINWSRGAEDGEAKIKNKNIRGNFEIP